MSSSAQVVVGFAIFILGLLLITGIIQAILSIAGWIAIVGGIILGVIGLFGMLSGKNKY